MHTSTYKFQIGQPVFFLEAEGPNLLSGIVEQVSIELYLNDTIPVSVVFYQISATTGTSCSTTSQVLESDMYESVADAMADMEGLVELNHV